MADPLKHWLSTGFGKAVKSHIDSGLRVFPIHGIKPDLTCTCGHADCTKNAGKHPYSKTVPNGFLNATDDIEIAGELFEYRSDLNVGVATGEMSRIFVIDVDNKNDGQGDRSLSRIQEVLGVLPETMRLTTGNGYHLIFDYPEGEKLKSSTKSFGDGYADIDVRANGGYIVIYPSRHASGRYYTPDDDCKIIADVPKMYIDYLKMDHRAKKNDAIVDRHQSSGNNSEWSEHEVERMLDCLEPDMTYNDWIAVGMALHKEGFSLDLWDRWSARGSKYAGIADLNGHWRSFNRSGDRTIGTVVEWATLQGWKPEYTPRIESDEANAVVDGFVASIEAKRRQPFAAVAAMIGEEAVEKIAADVFQDVVIEEKPVPQKKLQLIKGASKKEPEKDELPVFVPQFAFDPLKLPGGLGETVRHITKYAIYDQPELALMNVLAFAGAVFGRRYASPINTRTNVYMVGIARTGGGKDHSRQMINSIALEAGLSGYIGGNSIRSDTGMLRGLSNNASQLLQLDEFGVFMQALSDRLAPFHVKCISKALMSLYSDSKGVYHHGDYADEKAKPIKIAAPNLCIYGTTTEDSYIPALKRSAIKSGELNRFIVIPSRHTPRPKRSLPPMEKNEELINWWNQFAPTSRSPLGVIANNATTVPVPIVVEWGECEEMQFSLNCEQSDMCNSDHPTRDLWSRLFENTIKIAMLFAIARDPEKPTLCKTDMDWGYSIVKSSIDYMATLAEHSMAETPQEAAHHEVMQAIIESPAGLSRSMLMRKFRKFRKRELDELIGSMIEEEAIAVERTTPKLGRPQVLYRYIIGSAESTQSA